MPRLTPLQWLIFVLLLLFFGFTVFAVTRDYYLRTLTRPAPTAAPASPHGVSPPTTSALPPASAIPQAITENNLDLLRQQADELFTQRRYADAVPYYKRILELAPDDADGYNDLGLSLHYLGDTSGALTQLRAGAAKDDQHQRVWLTLGFVNLQAGAVEEARATLEHARDLDASTSIGQEAERLLQLIGQ